MNKESEELIFRWYSNLEDQLAMYLRHVPPYGPNLQAWSPTMASVILSGCGLLDSLLRDLSGPLLTRHSITKTADELNIADYYSIFENEWKLSERKGIFLVSPPEMLNPFGAWMSSTYAPLPWWQIHNDLKHDLLGNIKKATVASARDTLCGVLLAISCSRGLYPHLLREGWIDPGSWGIPHLLESLGTSVRMTMDTDLFAVPIGYRTAVTDIREFNPNHWEVSSRVFAFFR